MKIELVYLVCVTLLTALMWIPYILDRLAVRAQGARQTPWRTSSSSPVLVANAAEVSDSATVLACVVYFWARVVHDLAYTLAMPRIRTLAFAAGFVAQMMLALQLLTR